MFRNIREQGAFCELTESNVARKSVASNNPNMHMRKEKSSILSHAYTKLTTLSMTFKAIFMVKREEDMGHS